MRALPVFLAVLLTPLLAPAAAADSAAVDTLLGGLEQAADLCGEPGVPMLDCVREEIHRLCSHLKDCSAVCDSFVPGFGEIVLPYYDPRRSVVRGSLLALEATNEGTLVGVIDYEIFVGLSFNVDC